MIIVDSDLKDKMNKVGYYIRIMAESNELDKEKVGQMIEDLRDVAGRLFQHWRKADK